MRNGLGAAGFQGAGNHHGVHADAGHGAAIDVDGVDLAGRHDLVHLLDEASQGGLAVLDPVFDLLTQRHAEHVA